MALRNIITPADDRLRRAALKVTSFDKTFQQLVDDLLLTMHAAPGVGLAAPQVGESLRLFVAHLEHEPAADDAEDAAPRMLNRAQSLQPLPRPAWGACW